MRFLWPRHGTLIVNGVRTGQKQATAPHTRAAIAPGEHERVTRCRPREWHKRQERPALVAPHSSNVCAPNLRLGLRLRHCSRAARRRRSISRASKASAHCAYAAATWQSMAAHRLWRLVCHRQCCQSLTCVLEPQQAAAAAAVAACCCLIQSSQRRSEACRNRVVLSLLRLRSFKPIDRSWMVARVLLRRVQLATCDDVGRARVRAPFGQNNEKKADLTIVTKRQIPSSHPSLGLSVFFLSFFTKRQILLTQGWT